MWLCPLQYLSHTLLPPCIHPSPPPPSIPRYALVQLLDEIFKEVKPGLSAYKDPKEAAESLKPLMEAAVKTVPASLRKCTLVALKATAGLRRLGVDQAERHLAAVREYLGQVYPSCVQAEEVPGLADTCGYLVFPHYSSGYLDTTFGKGN